MIASSPLAPLTTYRRSALQALYVQFETEIEKLNQRVEEQTAKVSHSPRLLTAVHFGFMSACRTH
jgi:hypothetical protein